MSGKRKIVVIICALSLLVLAFFASGLAWKIYPGEYEVVQETYVSDPYQVNVSGMENLEDFPIDNSRDGMDWNKMELPRPCVNGENENTYVMVSRGSSEKIFIYMQGGGAGTSYLTSQMMVITLNPKFEQTADSTSGIFNRKENRNPFKEWTMVFIPYSTGDVHAGNRVISYKAPLSQESKTVHHAGMVNVTTVLRWVARQNFDFDNMVLGGSSAGGYGTIMNVYHADKIFDQSIVAINDAGPGLASKIDPAFRLERTINTWGWGQNLPSEFIEHVREKGEPVYGLEKLSENFDVIYGLCEDEKDVIMGTVFLKYPPFYFKDVLLSVSSDLVESNPGSFSRFLVDGYDHTLLPRERFYKENVRGKQVYEWVNGLLKGKVKSYVD